MAIDWRRASISFGFANYGWFQLDIDFERFLEWEQWGGEADVDEVLDFLEGVAADGGRANAQVFVDFESRDWLIRVSPARPDPGRGSRLNFLVLADEGAELRDRHGPAARVTCALRVRPLRLVRLVYAAWRVFIADTTLDPNGARPEVAWLDDRQIDLRRFRRERLDEMLRPFDLERAERRYRACRDGGDSASATAIDETPLVTPYWDPEMARAMRKPS
jgi:hypothetical protein